MARLINGIPAHNSSAEEFLSKPGKEILQKLRDCYGLTGSKLNAPYFLVEEIIKNIREATELTSNDITAFISFAEEIKNPWMAGFVEGEQKNRELTKQPADIVITQRR